MASKRSRKRRHIALAIACAVAMTTGAALAHQGATGVIKTRMDAMKAMADALKPVGAMAKRQRSYDAKAVAKAATVVRERAAEIPKLFPVQSVSPVSEALPLIWAEWDRFLEDARGLDRAASALAAASADEAAWKPAFTELAKACKGCHERYREEKDEHGH